MHMYNDQLYTCGSLGIIIFLLILSKIASKRDEYSFGVISLLPIYLLCYEMS